MIVASFEERAKYIENIVTSLKEPTSFEEFASKVFSPSNRGFEQVIGARKNEMMHLD